MKNNLITRIKIFFYAVFTEAPLWRCQLSENVFTVLTCKTLAYQTSDRKQCHMFIDYNAKLPRALSMLKDYKRNRKIEWNRANFKKVK